MIEVTLALESEGNGNELPVGYKLYAVYCYTRMAEPSQLITYMTMDKEDRIISRHLDRDEVIRLLWAYEEIVDK